MARVKFGELSELNLTQRVSEGTRVGGGGVRVHGEKEIKRVNEREDDNQGWSLRTPMAEKTRSRSAK